MLIIAIYLFESNIISSHARSIYTYKCRFTFTFSTYRLIFFCLQSWTIFLGICFFLLETCLYFCKAILEKGMKFNMVLLCQVV